MREMKNRHPSFAGPFLAIAWMIGSTTPGAWGQADAKPDRPSTVSQPPLPEPGTPGSATSAPMTVEERLMKMEEAYRRMEQVNRRILSQYDALSKRYEDLNRRVHPEEASDPRATGSIMRPASRMGAVEFQEPPGSEAGRGMGAEGMGGRTSPRESFSPGLEGVERRAIPRESAGLPPNVAGGAGGGGVLQGAQAGISRRGAGGFGAQGTEGRVFPPETSARGDEKLPRRLAKVEFAEGLELSSEDEEFKLTFHNLTQAEYRAFPTNDQGILDSQFFIPRQRWYFTGRVSKNVEYYTVINRGYGSLDLLDAFISYRIDERFRLRVGRMKTPFLYEYYSIAEGDLIAPERSIFAGNLAGNRQIGLMALGELYEGRLGYAVGVYNGPRRSFQDFNGAKDVIGYVNSRPFLKSESLKAFNYLNLGGSYMFGYQNDPTQPQAFRTANDETASAAADSLSPTFLSLNNNVVERGERVQWGGHMAWFWKRLMVLAEYGGGNAGYSFANSKYSTYIPYNGYFAQVSYFLTGEELTRRVNVVRPRRDFSFVKGKRAPGAIEVHARYSTLDFGKKVFTAGFADPNLYSNEVWATDVGLNWYLNFYTKLYLDWQHSEFGSPVVSAPNRFGLTRDLFWVRFQVFF
jgi:phosphate-selective porin OprO/OprP